MSQQPLWHDTIEDALRSLVDALGGYKKVGADLWPAMKADAAGRRLADCLNPGRDHNLESRELLWLLKRGKERGVHVAMHFITREAGYKEPEELNPEDEKAKLQREFIEAQRALQALANRYDRITSLRSVV